MFTYCKPCCRVHVNYLQPVKTIAGFSRYTFANDAGITVNSQFYFQLISPLIFLVFALGFGLVYRFAKDQVSARYISMSYLLAAIAFVLDICRTYVPGIVDNLMSNVAYMMSAAVFTVALMTHYRKKKPWALLGTLVGLAVSISFYFMIIDNDMAARALVLNFFGSMLLAYPLVALWGMEKRPIDRFIYWLIAFTVVQYQLRAAIVLFIEWNTLTEATYADSLAAVTFQLTTSVSALLMALALFFMYGMEIVLKLRLTSETDLLTGVLNRRGMEAKLPEFEEGLANGVESHAVLILDIDHFKDVNDRFGHSAGDAVLVACANLLKKLEFEQTIVARMGGEEFSLILYNANESTARLAADYVCSAFSQLTHVTIDGEAVTVSVGVALWQDRDSFSGVARLADTALYRAKSEGRNRVCVAPQIRGDRFQTRGNERRETQAGIVTLRT